jgi:MYXO-CTERM domain-containing protein
MAQPTGSSSPWAVGLAVLGACVAFSRRRRA